MNNKDNEQKSPSTRYSCKNLYDFYIFLKEEKHNVAKEFYNPAVLESYLNSMECWILDNCDIESMKTTETLTMDDLYTIISAAAGYK
jgi:hypothetical protein